MQTVYTKKHLCWRESSRRHYKKARATVNSKTEVELNVLEAALVVSVAVVGTAGLGETEGGETEGGETVGFGGKAEGGETEGGETLHSSCSSVLANQQW